MTGLGDLKRESPCLIELCLIELCLIERSLPLPQRASFASHALPPRLWRIEEAIAQAVSAWAVMAVSIGGAYRGAYVRRGVGAAAVGAAVAAPYYNGGYYYSAACGYYPNPPCN